MPTLITANLSYQKCAELFAKARSPHKGKPLCSRGHITVQQRNDTTYAVQMWHTDILTFHADGRVEMDNYDSPTTRQVMNELAPYRLGFWSDSRMPFACKYRFGTHWRNSRCGYPFAHNITISADGTFQPPSDFKRVVNPAFKAERADIRKRLWANALPRILLGEFDVLQPNCVTGWLAPSIAHCAALFLNNADHDQIADALKRRCFFDGPVRATKEQALVASVQQMIDAILSDNRFYHLVEVPYPAVQL